MLDFVERSQLEITKVKNDLMEGNKRHMNSAWQHPGLTHAKQNDQSFFMRPNAVVLCGSDCRVVPHFIFDQGLGTLQVVQTGGPAASPETLAAIDYAVLEQACRVIIVLCAEDDPVMRAAMDYGEHGENIASQSKKFYNTFSWAASEGPRDIATMNALYVAYKCTLHSEAVRKRAELGVLEVIPALHNVLTGEVTFLPFWTPEDPKPADAVTASIAKRLLDNERTH
jgi:carbonic anhydrase